MNFKITTTKNVFDVEKKKCHTLSKSSAEKIKWPAKEQNALKFTNKNLDDDIKLAFRLLFIAM